jgi:hypothetical protein
MTREQVWELLQSGCNANEIAAAAHVGTDVARSMCDEALGRVRGATLRRRDAANAALHAQRQVLAMSGRVVSW